MSLGRVLAWVVVAGVIGTGIYFLVAGERDTPEALAPAPAPAAPSRLLAPAAAPPTADEAESPGDALAREGAEAEEKLKRDQADEIRAMPPAPPDMGMTDKAGIEKDAEEAAKAAGRKP